MDPVIGAALIKTGGDLLGNMLPTSTTTKTNSTSSASGTSTTQKNLSQAAIDKLVYDVLSGDQGLASLATGENLSGGYGSSTKALLAQDFVVKLVGELANITAPTVTTQSQEAKQQSTSKSKKKMSVICTELHRQGLLGDWLYNHPKALKHFESLPWNTVRGYQLWGNPVVARMKKSTALSLALAPIAHGRYVQIVTGKRTFSGMLTIYIGQPICYAIGAALALKDTICGIQTGDNRHGYSS